MSFQRVCVGQHDVASADQIEQFFGTKPLPTQGDRSFAYWEQQVHACLTLLASKGVILTDEMRRCIEALEPDVYANASYYEKWAIALTTALLERKVFTNADLDAKFGSVVSTISEPLAPGEIVRVRNSSYHTRWRRPHLRTPGFVHGICGTVERCVGKFGNPEKLAFGNDTAGLQPLYIIHFDWPSICDFPVATGQSDVVTCEIYHDWLEPASAEELEHQRQSSRKRVLEVGIHPDCKAARKSSSEDKPDHDDHAHEERAAVEQRAADSEIPRPVVARALVDVLLDKKVITTDELQAAIQKMDALNSDRGTVGRKLVVKAWSDEGFKKRLLEDANAACKELGVNASSPHVHIRLVVVEQTKKVHHLLVCTLCSCYPLMILGAPPDWYKSREYRSRAVREPRTLLKDFGTVVPNETQVMVHDSTADCRYMVLPLRPEGTVGWGEPELEALVTRDSMVGVTVLADRA